MEWVLSKGELRPHGATVRGMLLGITGVGILVAPDALKQGLHGGLVLGFLLLQVGCVGWVTGALLQKRMVSRSHAIVSGAVQQLATGLVFLLLGALFEHYPTHVTTSAVSGLLYLVFFGAILGYSAFVYAMEQLPATIVSIYTFVNPIVAVILGWLVFHESFGWRVVIAMALIFAGVAVVKFSGTREAKIALDATDRLAVTD
jgi:drug/metabolite transporter (DMT)-like permease